MEGIISYEKMRANLAQVVSVRLEMGNLGVQFPTEPWEMYLGPVTQGWLVGTRGWGENYEDHPDLVGGKME